MDDLYNLTKEQLEALLLKLVASLLESFGVNSLMELLKDILEFLSTKYSVTLNIKESMYYNPNGNSDTIINLASYGTLRKTSKYPPTFTGTITAAHKPQIKN
jgi:hypothetical protein